MAVGKDSTRRIDQFVKLDKEYEATFVLGATSTKHDPEGTLTTHTTDTVDRTAIETVLTRFLGTIEQISPMHSAIKIGDQRLYKLARESKEVERKPRRITIHAFDMLDFTWPELRVHILCSSGTYVRSLARDFGEILDVGAYVSQLRRTKIGSFSVDDTLKLEKLTPENWHTLLITDTPQ